MTSPTRVGPPRKILMEDVRRCMAARAPMYRWRAPVYQHTAICALRELWDSSHRSALDVGGGTGAMAQTIKTLFDLDRVASVDVKDRYIRNLDIRTSVFDGVQLPFTDASFDCVLLFNVLHHVPVASRAKLLLECRRVAGSGPIYVKDHVSKGHADDFRLTLLDLMGNLPVNGMVRAHYLREEDWRHLASTTGHLIDGRISGTYRSGGFRMLFPNALEISMRWRAAPE